MKELAEIPFQRLQEKLILSPEALIQIIISECRSQNLSDRDTAYSISRYISLFIESNNLSINVFSPKQLLRFENLQHRSDCGNSAGYNSNNK